MTASSEATETLREFIYLDEASVQSLLASQIGALPAEVTSLSSRASESEIGATLGGGVPLVAKAELASRYKGSSSTSNQVLSRAVAESLFKHLYDLVSDRLVWSPGREAEPNPVSLVRGDLIEIEVDLAPDPVYGFNATMGLLNDIADDYPALLDDSGTAMILAEAGVITKVLERLLVGLIPIKAEASELATAELEGLSVVAPRPYFEAKGIASNPVSLVGVTEQDKYWRDVRRVLFSKSRFTVLGRINRNGLQKSWTPVKLTEVMRDIAPKFPDMITRAGLVGYSSPVNMREEGNRDALEKALLHYALEAGGELAAERRQDIEEFAKTQRSHADTLTQQARAFDALIDWMVQGAFIETVPENSRQLRSEARKVSGLRSSSAVTSLTDFVNPGPKEEPRDEALIDIEIIAIYW